MVSAHGPESTATLLADGKVLVAGGEDESAGGSGNVSVTAAAELYDPSTGQWTATGDMTMSRSQHTATLLQDGRVLVAGGVCSKRCPAKFDPDLDPSGAVATAEIYDPRTGKWNVTGSMTTPRALHTATLLADGKVLVAGAEHADENFGWPEPFARGILASTELYDPGTGKWTATGSMTTPRTQQLAALLRDGKVLVVGGIGPVSPTAHDVLASAEVYNPATGKWTATGRLTTARAYGAAATILKDGKVLLTGGDGPGDPNLASAELYDPLSGTWTTTGSMATARGVLAATLLADGKVLVSAGCDCGGPGPLLAFAEIYDPSSGTWTAAASLITARWGHTATLLKNGKVLVAGGGTNGGSASSAELYDEAGT